MIKYSNPPALVDAIEEGRIVKVTEDYARREGLLILRKSFSVVSEPTVVQKKEEEARRNRGFIGMDDLRKPLKSKENELQKELVENFHWMLVEKRKVRGLTRKKLADSIGESETNVKMIENGVLPVNNFILVNKLESFYGISLRKNKIASVPSDRPLRQPIDFAGKIAARRMEKSGSSKNATELVGSVEPAARKDAPAESEEEKKEVLDLSADGEIDISKL